MFGKRRGGVWDERRIFILRYLCFMQFIVDMIKLMRLQWSRHGFLTKKHDKFKLIVGGKVSFCQS